MSNYGLSVNHPQYGEVLFNTTPFHPFYMVYIYGGPSNLAPTVFNIGSYTGTAVWTIGAGKSSPDRSINLGGATTEVIYIDGISISGSTVTITWAKSNNSSYDPAYRNFNCLTFYATR